MKQKISHTEEISRADAVADLLSGNAKGSLTAVFRPIAYRAPVHILAVVDAMAVLSKKSRNAMLNILLSVAIEEVRGKLDSSVMEKLQIEESKAIADFDSQAIPGESFATE